jgi:acetyltransferase-like isoleucine patch superfamily enzyme
MVDGAGPLFPWGLIRSAHGQFVDRLLKWADAVRHSIRYAGIIQNRIGEDVEIYMPSNIYGAEIGSHVRIGPFVEIQRGVRIGNYVKIGSHSFLCDGVTIGDYVFVGHGVMFCNDRYPRSAMLRSQKLKARADWVLTPVVVEAGASIGTGAVILPGVTIGMGALIGAGAVVTRSVPAWEVWIGNPAHCVRRLSPYAHGTKTEGQDKRRR